MTFRVRNVVNGAEQTVHARNLKCVDIDTWDVPQERLKESRGKRKSTYAVPPSDEYDSEVSINPSNSVGSHGSESDFSNTDDNVPLARLIKRRTYEGSDSSDSDEDIPLAELKRKYERKAERIRQTEAGTKSDNQDYTDMEVNMLGLRKSRRDRQNTSDIVLSLIRKLLD